MSFTYIFIDGNWRFSSKCSNRLYLTLLLRKVKTKYKKSSNETSEKYYLDAQYMWGEIITTKISRDESNKKTILHVCAVFLEINPTTVLLSFLHSKPLKRDSIRLGFQPSASHSWALCASLLVLFHLCLIFIFLHMYKIYIPLPKYYWKF